MFKVFHKFNQDKRRVTFGGLSAGSFALNPLPNRKLPEFSTITGLTPVDIPGDSFPPELAGKNLQERTTPGFQSLPSGIQAVGGTAIQPDQPLISPKIINDLIGDVRSPDSRVTNLKLPDGLEIGFTPEEPLPAGVEAGGKDFIPGRTGKDVGFFDKVAQAIRDPRFGYVTGKLAQAVAPSSPGIQQAGGLGAELAVGRGLGEFERVLNEGGDLQDPKFSFIPSELKQQAIQAKLEGRKLDIQEQYMSALGEQAKATALGTLTVEQKQDVESQANATRLQLGRLSNKYMNVGQGHVFDVETGDVIKAYDYKTGSGGSAIGNLNSSDYRLFNEYTTATFLPTAIENRRAEVVKAQGEEFASTIDLIQEFKNEDGSTNFQRLMKYLSEEERVQFAGQLNEYTNNVARGISPTGTFLQQQIAANTITTPDGKTWRILPDGSYEEVK